MNMIKVMECERVYSILELLFCLDKKKLPKKIKATDNFVAPVFKLANFLWHNCFSH